MRHSVHGFVGGLITPWHALKFIRQHPVLWSYIIWPFVIAFLVITLGEVLSIWAVWHWIGNIFADATAWYWVALIWVMKVIVGVALLIGGTLVFTLIASVIAAPFHEVLSERVEQVYFNSAADHTPFQMSTLPQIAKTAIREETKKLLFFGTTQLVLLLFHIIPVIGQILYVITNTTLSSYVFAFEFISLPLERQDLSFSQKRAFLRQDYGRTFGFGLACLGLFLVPVLNAFSLPLCVVSGTLIYCQQVQKPV